MGDHIWERFAEHLLYETKEWVDVTQLENMTWLSRKIINVLDNFTWPHQDSPDAASIMTYLMKETGITDEEIILNNILNILKFKNNDTIVWESWTEKKTLVSLKIYNYCVTLVKWYQNLLEKISGTQEDISDTFESATENEKQLKIDFPEED